MATRKPSKSRSQSPAPPSNGEPRPSTRPTFPIVGIGASAGGLEAFTQVLSSLPKKSGMALVLVQHLSPMHESALPELLRRATKLPISEVVDGVEVKPNAVYVIPPNTSMGILDGRLRLIPRTRARSHLPIDFFLSSLAEECGNRAMGVILSGTASDGSLGVTAIKAAGGITIAEDPKSAKYGDMPRNAIATGCIDFVLRPQDIARELIRLSRHPYLRQDAAAGGPEFPKESEGGLRRIFALLRTATGVDFADYKHSTIKRRIKRRMMLYKARDLKEYLHRLQENRTELDALYQDILIHVTGFFRDPEVFDTLKTRIFPSLLKQRLSRAPIRIWVPGCSTGEEVYSIAICLLELLGDAARSTEVQIFATDISDIAIEKARTGIYPEQIAAQVSPERLRNFFAKMTRGYQINKTIRDVCVFARQDITTDPPFSRVDLISCRNLLIYLGAVLQRRVLQVFHYALKPEGYLLLGTSETIGGFPGLFSLADKKHKFYTKNAASVRALDFLHNAPAVEPTPRAHKSEEVESRFDYQREADRTLLSHYAPAGVVVNADLEILQFRGRTGRFLEPASGQPSLSLAKMAREGLLVDIREAIERARKNDAPYKKRGVPLGQNGQLAEVNIDVFPIKGPLARDRYYLVMFEEVPPPKARKPLPREASRESVDRRLHEQRAAQLKLELTQTKSTLQSIIEEQETTNEELKSANEEILSSNEELQSTNEELETAKEELQSTNEELNTLNEELQNRNLELATANNDLLNLLASVNIPTLMLGNDLRIRHFTPPAEKLLNLIASDVGRPISHLKPNLLVNSIEQMIASAINRPGAADDEVQDRQGRWYSMRIRPYKTPENRLEGAVVTWIDITALKATLEGTERALNEAAVRYRLLFERNLAGVFRAAIHGPVLECNTAFASIFGYRAPHELTSVRTADLWCTSAEFQGYLARLQEAEGRLHEEVRLCRKDGTTVWVLMNASLAHTEEAAAGEIEGVVMDVTERKKAEETLQKLSQRLRDSREAERKRISRELHGATASNLSAVIANLALALNPNHPLNQRVRAALAESLKLSKQCLKEIRTVSYLLRPPLLDEVGLLPALRALVRGYAKRSKLRVEMDLSPAVGSLPDPMELAFFRIAQESLTNIHLHARSTSVQVRLAHVEKNIVLEIRDDGRGMPARAQGADKEQFEAGLGIPDMRDRATQLGGTLEIISGKHGTTVRATLPVPPAHPKDEKVSDLK